MKLFIFKNEMERLISSPSVVQNQELQGVDLVNFNLFILFTREQRIRYAKEILQKEMLPHVGISEHCETKKAVSI